MDGVFSKEQEELMAIFERTMKKYINRIDKEPKELWSSRQIYQNGETNMAFIAFRMGYALGKVVEHENNE